MMLSPAQLLAQATSPDPVGVTLALFRTRVYRFSDDPRHYVLAEWLEERFIGGQHPQPATLTYLNACLAEIRHNGSLLAFPPDLAAREGLDVDSELAQRYDLDHPVAQPDRLVFIVGAPRSGTSHLHNLLAHTGHFAYFTTVSCWAWPTRNLSRPERRSFEYLDDRIFDLDNKATRIVPALVMPAEAEDMHARAIPTYRHQSGHTYELIPAELRDPELLRYVVSAHVAHFNRPVFLCKSPFNSLRIPILERIWGEKAHYVHMVRDRSAVAASMERNNFRYMWRGRLLSGEEAWAVFVTNALEHAPQDRLLTVTFDELQADPQRTGAAIMA